MSRELTSWVPAGCLALGCIFTLAVNRQVGAELRTPLDSIPMVLAGREGRAGTLPDDQREAAGMTSYITRYFPADTAPFEIYVGFYDQQTQGKTIHSPKNCLPGSGWEALQQRTTEVPTPDGPVTVNRYLLQNKEARALVFYWYQGRGRVASNEYRVKWELLRDAALRGRSEESLVRVVVHLNEGTSEERAAEVATRVAGELVPAVARAMPDW
jgi:EpsI family protein